MALTHSETDICNMALTRVKSQHIADLTEDSEAARKCAFVYPIERDILMAEFPWNFAIKRAELAQSATTPDFEYDYQYEIPADMLRAWEKYAGTGKHDISDPWVREGNFLLSNDDEFKLLYISHIEDTTKFSPFFLLVLYLRVASVLAVKLANSVTLQTAILKEMTVALDRAKLLELHEGNKDQAPADSNFSWAGGRRTG